MTTTDLISVTDHKGGAGIYSGFSAVSDAPMMDHQRISGQVLSHTPRVCLPAASSQSSPNCGISFPFLQKLTCSGKLHINVELSKVKHSLFYFFHTGWVWGG